MKIKQIILVLSGWIFFTMVLTIAILNLLLVHPVPGIIAFFLSLVYLPPVNIFLKEKFGLVIHNSIKIILGIFIIWFTLGISDLGDIIDHFLNQ